MKYSKETQDAMYEALKGIEQWWVREFDSFPPEPIVKVRQALNKAEEVQLTSLHGGLVTPFSEGEPSNIGAVERLIEPALK